MSKAFGQRPSAFVCFEGLFSPMEMFEIDRHIHYIGNQEEARIMKAAIEDMKRGAKKKPKGRKRKCYGERSQNNIIDQGRVFTGD